MAVDGREGIHGIYGPFPRTKEYWDLLLSSTKNQIIALSWKGNEENSHFLIEPRVKFDFLYNNDPSLGVDNTVTIVPEALVAEIYRNSLQDLRGLVDRLREQGAARIILISSPPPKREAVVRMGLRVERAFIKMIQDRGLTFDQVQISPEGLRMKLWRLHQDKVREIARSTGAIYLPPPSASIDSDGFLLGKYSHVDATHANFDYGTLVVRELIEAGRC